MNLCIQINCRKKNLLKDSSIQARKWDDFIKIYSDHKERADHIYHFALSIGFICPTVYFMSDDLVLFWDNDDYFVSVVIPRKGEAFINWGRSYQEPNVSAYSMDRLVQLSDYLYPGEENAEVRKWSRKIR